MSAKNKLPKTEKPFKKAFDAYDSTGLAMFTSPLNRKFINNNTNSVNRVGVNTLPILSTSFFGFKHNHSAVVKNNRE